MVIHKGVIRMPTSSFKTTVIESVEFTKIGKLSVIKFVNSSKIDIFVGKLGYSIECDKCRLKHIFSDKYDDIIPGCMYEDQVNASMTSPMCIAIGGIQSAHVGLATVNDISLYLSKYMRKLFKL